MNILAPVKSPEEARSVIEAGADELFCGFMPSAWTLHYSHIASPNRREWKSANIMGEQELARVVSEAHSRKVPVFLTLNALYTKSQYPMVIEQIKIFKDMKVNGFIVADLGLLVLLRKEKIPIDVHVSTGGTVFNFATAMFYRDLGVKRIILPRHIKIEEAGEIVKKCPGVEFEAFILNSGCKNIDGFCTFQHGIQEMNRKGLWELPKRLNCDTFLLESMRRLPKSVLQSVRSNIFGIDSACLIDYKVALISSVALVPDTVKKMILQNISSSFRLCSGMDPCGACRLEELAAIGIRSVKIVGRNYSLDKKVKDVRFIKGVLSLLKERVDKSRRTEQVKKFYRSVYRTDCREMCYYPYEDTSH